MSSAHATLPVPDAQALPGRTVLSNRTPGSRQESFVRKRRIVDFFLDIREGDDVDIVPDDDDTDPVPEEGCAAAGMRLVEFDGQVMAHEWSLVPVAEMPQEPQQPATTLNYFDRYPQHQGKLSPISEHPRFG